MKRVLSIGIAAALMVVGGGAFVAAQTTSSIPACADIVGGEGGYTAPKRETNAAEVQKALDNLGRLNFTMYVGGDSATPAASCENVTYSIVVLDEYPSFGEKVVAGEGGLLQKFVTSPEVLATASVPGDGLTNALQFRISVDDLDPEVIVNGQSASPAVCVYLTTSGTPPSGTQTNNGAAFDGGPAHTLLDRAPNGGKDAYCVLIGRTGGATAYR
jgi:hypothetical protein